MKHTPEDALELCQWLEAKLLPNAHCALAGSVCTKGGSDNDIDIIVYPHNVRAEDPSKQTKEDLYTLLQNICPGATDASVDAGYPRDRMILVWFVGNITINFIVLKD